jgi:hypothetical protein
MPKKIKLRLDDFSITSFPTTNSIVAGAMMHSLPPGHAGPCCGSYLHTCCQTPTDCKPGYTKD